MSRHLNVKKTASHAMILLVLLTALFFVADIASAALSCNSCHGNPPADGTRTGATGSSSFTGNHSQHVFGAGNSAVALNICTTCHGSAASGYTAAHSAYTSASMKAPYVNMASKIGNYSAAHGRARYNKGTFNSAKQTVFFNQSSIPALTTCSNVDCHFERKTPTWGSAAFVPNTDCNRCHGVPPSGVSNANPLMDYTGGAAGSHAKHDLYYTGVTNGCVKCHSDHTSELNKFAHATSGRSGHNLVVALKTPTNQAEAGTYSRIPVYPSYYPSAAGTVTFGTCNTIYCHSDGTKSSGSYTKIGAAPQWGASLACNGCHGDLTINPIASGSHTKHINSLNCADCHNGTISSGSTSLSDLTKHVNKFVDLQFPASRAVGTVTYGGSNAPLAKTSTGAPGYGSCTNAKCHNDGTGVWNGTYVLQTTPTWGSAGGCDKCHGNATYTDYRKAAPLYVSGSPKPNAHLYHVDARTTPMNEIQCGNCHATVTASNSAINGTQPSNHANDIYNIDAGGTFRDGDNPGDSTAVTVSTTSSSSPTVNNCSNVSCHPIGLDTVTGTPNTRLAASVAWDNNYKCIDCHSMNMQATDTFHHAMRNYSSTYPTAAPNGDASSGTNPQNRRCTMCHVDHKIFSPNLNTNSGGRAYNLRTDITAAPTTTSNYTNSDFVGIPGGTGGICISCHQNAKTKDATRRRNDTGVTITPVISFLNFSGSSHQFTVPGKMLSDSSTFQGDCSKCHNATMNETSLFMNITTAAGSTGQSFGNHNGGVRRLQGSLGAAGGETAEEQICYRCHHDAVADAASSPGGGPPKVVGGKDYYGVKSMDTGSEGIFAIMQRNGLRQVNPVSSFSNKLFFKPGTTPHTDFNGTVFPANPMPATPTNDDDLGDTFAGGSYLIRSMSPWDPAIAYTTDIRSTTSTLSGLRYWEMVKFVSPPAADLSGDLAGTWTIGVYSRESSNSLNARIRYMVYKWSGGGAGSKGATIIAKGTYATELPTTAAPGTIRQIAINVGPGTTLAIGEKIVVDLALQTNEGTTTSSRSGYFYFGKGAPSNLTLPKSVSWTYGDPGSGVSGYGHNVGGYTGLHKPSPVDETRGSISDNKHVECVDCHNPHALKSGLHTAGSSAMATALRGAFGVGITTWAGNWLGVTTYNPSTTTAPLITATAEWQVCFKCHSGANANFANWSSHDHISKAPTGAAAWTDLSLEFNPNNRSGHPIITGLNNYPNSVAPKALTAAQMKAPWTAVGTQVMTCSDCHATDSTTSKGPHGSSVKWMLIGTNKNWPYTTAAGNGKSTGTLVTMGGLSFCENCHVTSTTGHNSRGSWTGQASEHTGKACVSCHIRVPHGGKTSRLLTGAAAPARYKPDGNGGGTIYLEGIVKWSSTPSQSNCYSSNGTCSGGNHGTTGSTTRW